MPEGRQACLTIMRKARLLYEEISDYGEVVAWAVSQPWCSGSVGAIGISYEGAAAERLISTGAAGIKGVVPQGKALFYYTLGEETWKYSAVCVQLPQLFPNGCRAFLYFCTVGGL